MSIEDAIRRNQDRLLSLPNVSRLGVGEEGGVEVILVFVRKQDFTTGLDQRQAIPDMIEGYRTVVRLELKIG